MKNLILEITSKWLNWNCMKHFYSLLVFLLSFLVGNDALARRCYSNTNGDWEDPTKWTCGTVPANGDTIYINPGHTITITTINNTLESGSPVFISISGTLKFNTGKKLNLSCGSGVNVNPGGSITSSGGGGANNQLTICGTTVWQTSDGTVTGPMNYGNALPVELLTFTAKKGDMTIFLDWVTGSELNNSHFNVERSTDGYEFFTIGQVPGQGTTNQNSVYEYIDIGAPEGLVYYRLVQVDFNGKSTIHDIIQVTNSASILLTFFPNPSNGNVLLLGGYEGEVSISLFNLLGQKVYFTGAALSRGSNELSFADKVSRGSFIFKVEGSGGEVLLQDRLIVE